MEAYLKLSAAAALPVIASAILYIIDKKTAFGKLKYPVRQAIIGVIFGILAIIGTEFGVPLNGAKMNVRDSAPLCAGLIFGAPAGIISGVIGGVERWFAALWGVGEYTRLACSIATVLAGLMGALLKKYMFDNKKPAWYYGLSTGMVAEVLHMLLIFLTNMSDTRKAFSLVQICFLPMVITNGIAVMLAVLIVSCIGKEKVPTRGKKISQTFQRWLLLCVIVAFLATSEFTYILQTRLSEADTNNLLTLNIEDVKKDIMDASDENLLKLTREVADRLNKSEEYSNEQICRMAEEYEIAEIDIIDDKGFITYCTNETFIGFDMSSGEQAAEFLVLLDGTEADNDNARKGINELVQSYQPISYNTAISRKYAGVRLERGGFVQVGYDASQFHRDISNAVIGTTRNRHVGEDGCVIICDENWNIVSDRNNFEGENLITTGIWIDKDTMPEKEIFSADVYDVNSYCMYIVAEGYFIIAVYPYSEAVFLRDISVYVSIFMEVIVFAMLFIMIYFLIKKLIVDKMRKINDSLALITNGNLDVTVNVRSNEEFASLSDDINSTVVTLKHYIDEAAARIDKELEFARSIQLSALPSVFPPYPERTDFDIFASMTPAKEVGGDFYDFYLLPNEKLAFLIADVSGKGIPGAMFMMTSKTMLKSLTETGMGVEEVFTKANEKLYENNSAEMFVTAWMGIIDLNTGLIEYANAGHNPPLVRHGDGSFEYLKARAGFVLAGMEGIKYRKGELQLQHGDMIFLYTDGVTEATDTNVKLYGEDRLLRTINSIQAEAPETFCRLIRRDVDEFVGEAPQFDDITTLMLVYR